jgi:hypothetical protein
VPRRQVIEPPGLGARLIANEHHHAAAIFELGELLVPLLHVCNTFESTKVVNGWFSPCHTSYGVFH